MWNCGIVELFSDFWIQGMPFSPLLRGASFSTSVSNFAQMNLNIFSILTVAFYFASCAPALRQRAFTGSHLRILPLSPRTYVHLSNLETETFGRVSCNGLVYIDRHEALILDCPVNDTAARELIRWIEEDTRSRITGVVINHFHNDCLGTLDLFHEKGIESWANETTLLLARKTGVPENKIPRNAFNQSLSLQNGKGRVINAFFGEGHTRDNIVSYIPGERVLFGGCLVKALQASKGYLGDADTAAWSGTVSKVKAAYSEVRYVVPGHGDYGDRSLLDYTMSLFQQ